MYGSLFISATNEVEIHGLQSSNFHGSTEVIPVFKNWADKSLSRQMDVGFSSAAPTPLNVFTERKMLDVFMPFLCLGDGRVSPPGIDIFRPTHDKSCLAGIRV